MKMSVTLAGMALLAGLVALVAGCEADPTSQAEIIVKPSYAEIGKGQSIVFKASGWHDYTWSLSTGGLGVLSRTKGDSTVYTSISSGSATQTLTVVGPAGLADASSTNSAATTSAPSTDVTIIHH